MTRFKQFAMLSLCVLSVLFLQACTNMEQEFKVGKQSFMQGDYHEAFRDLAPAAKQGNADAQYAVGYMYYYGLGTPQNKTLAIRWMHAAAAQGQPLAKQALMQIDPRSLQQRGAFPRPRTGGRRYGGGGGGSRAADVATKKKAAWPVAAGASNNSTSSGAATTNAPVPMIKSAPANSGTTTTPASGYTPPPIPAAPSSSNRGSSDSMTQASTKATLAQKTATTTGSQHYTLQILASHDQAYVKNMAKEYDLQAPHIYHTKVNGKPWYVLTDGDYPSMDDAKAAMVNLPDQAQQRGPWVRSVNSVQKQEIRG